MVTERPPVTTVEDAKAVFVARAMWARGYYGHSAYVHEALNAAGLQNYYVTEGTQFKISTARLFEMLGGDQFAIILTNGRTPTRHHGYIRDAVYGTVCSWASSITDADWTEVEPSDKVIDVDAVSATYGHHGALPPAGNDEVTQTWRELVQAVLTWGDSKDLCTELEEILERIGFGEFLGPRTVNVVVEWQGQVFTLEGVTANRSGQPRPEYLQSALMDKIRTSEIKVNEVIPASVESDDDDDEDDD